jgi:hypothetical protein
MSSAIQVPGFAVNLTGPSGFDNLEHLAFFMSSGRENLLNELVR